MTYTEFQTLRKEAADAAQINAENAALTDKRLANTGYGKAYMDVPAPQELLYHGLGAVGGGTLGYLLSRALHRKPSGLLRTLYTIGGAGVGGIAPYYLLRTGKDSNGMTAAERLRLQNAWAHAPKEMQERRNMYEGIEPSKKKGPFEELTNAVVTHPIALGTTGGALIDAGRFLREAGRVESNNLKVDALKDALNKAPKNSPIRNAHVNLEDLTYQQPPKLFPSKATFKRSPAAGVYGVARRGAFTLGGTAAGIIATLIRHNLNKQRIVDPISDEEMKKIFN